MELDVEIIKWLAEEDKLFSKEKMEHNYPHCWRCGHHCFIMQSQAGTLK